MAAADSAVVPLVLDRRNLFLWITSHHDVLEQKKIFSNKTAMQKKKVALENSLRLHTRGGPSPAVEAL